MGIVHKFGYVEDSSGGAVIGLEKPFCYIDFGPNASSATAAVFKYYT